MDQLAEYHKRHQKVRKLSLTVLPMLFAGLMACTGGNQEDAGVLSGDEPLEIASESDDSPAANPFSKVSAIVNSDKQAASSVNVAKPMLTGAARQTEIYLTNGNGSDASSASWQCETINTDNEENKVSLKFDSDNSGTLNNLMMSWSVTAENIIVITIPDMGFVRLSGIEFEIEDGDPIQFTSIDDKAEHSNCTRAY